MKRLLFFCIFYITVISADNDTGNIVVLENSEDKTHELKQLDPNNPESGEDKSSADTQDDLVSDEAPSEQVTDADVSKSESGATSGERGATSGDGGVTSGDHGQSSGDREETPEDGGDTSGDRGVTSGDRGESSGDQGGTSGDRKETPEDGGETSGDRGETSKDREESSGDQVITSGDRGETSNDREETSDEQINDNSQPASEQNTEEKSEENRLKAEHWNRWLSEVAAGNPNDLGQNPHFHQPDKYPDFSRRFVPQYPYTETGQNADAAEPENREIIPVKAPLELVRLVAKESALIEAAKPKDSYADELAKNKMLRSGDYWNAVWVEDVDPKTLLRTSNNQALGTIKAKVKPGSEFYDIVTRLKQMSPRLLYVINESAE